MFGECPRTGVAGAGRAAAGAQTYRSTSRCRRAAAVGLVALPVAAVGLAPSSALRGLLLGVGAGVFLHVAVDLLPECTAGSETCPADAASDGHRLRDRLRTHAAISSVTGGVAFALAWPLIT